MHGSTSIFNNTFPYVLCGKYYGLAYHGAYTHILAYSSGGIAVLIYFRNSLILCIFLHFHR